MVALLAFVGAAFLVSGSITRSWVVCGIAVVAAPAFYSSLAVGLIGNGVGDSWQLVAVAVWLVSILSSVVGVLVGRTLFGRIESG